jgi:hypothetical protein
MEDTQEHNYLKEVALSSSLLKLRKKGVKEARYEDTQEKHHN